MFAVVYGLDVVPVPVDGVALAAFERGGLFAVLCPQPRSLAAVFGDLVGLLLLELRRDMRLGPALVGALLRFLLRCPRCRVCCCCVF